MPVNFRPLFGKAPPQRGPYGPSDAARAASDYYNSLPLLERRKLSPLLEHYRQLGLAEARKGIAAEVRFIDARIRSIREGGR